MRQSLCFNMKRVIAFVAAMVAMLPLMGQARSEMLLKEGWRFVNGDVNGAEAPLFDDSSWETVAVPHDWAIRGPFDIGNDLQKVAVVQNGETVSTLKTGRTGGGCHIWARVGTAPHLRPRRSIASSLYSTVP